MDLRRKLERLNTAPLSPPSEDPDKTALLAGLRRKMAEILAKAPPPPVSRADPALTSVPAAAPADANVSRTSESA